MTKTKFNCLLRMSFSSDASKLDRHRDRQRRIRFRAKVREEHRSGSQMLGNGVFLEHLDGGKDKDGRPCRPLALSTSSKPPVSSRTGLRGNWSGPKSPIASIPSQAAFEGRSSIFLNCQYPCLPKTSEVVEKEDLGKVDEGISRYRSGQNLVSVLNRPAEDPKSLGPLLMTAFLGDGSSNPVPMKQSQDDVPIGNIRDHLRKMGPAHQKWTDRRGLTFEDLIWLYSPSLSRRSSRSLRVEKLRKLGKRNVHVEERRPQSPGPQLSEIPDVFLDHNFKVSDKDFFASLLQPNQQILKQEELSQYLDLVEMSILNQISNQSESFFSALCTVQDLFVKMSFLCVWIKKVRIRIRAIKQSLVERTLALFQKHRRLENHRKVLRVVESIKKFQNSLQTVKALMSSGEYLYAVELLEIAKNLILDELGSFSSLHAFRFKIDEMKRLLMKLLISDLDHIAFVSNIGTVMEGGLCQIMQIMESALRLDDTNSISSAVLNMFYTLAHQQIAPVFQEFMPGNFLSEKICLDTTDPNFLSALKTLDSDSYLKLVEYLEEAIESLSKSFSVIFSDLENEITAKKDEMIESTLLESLNSVREKLGTQLPRCLCSLIEVRPLDLVCSTALDFAKQRASLLNVLESLEGFVRSTLFNARNVVLTQTTAFISFFHQEMIKELSEKLESENWSRVNVPRRCQRLVDNGFITIPGEIPPPVSNDLNRLSNPSLKQLEAARKVWWNAEDGQMNLKSSADEQELGLDCLVVHEERFKVVSSTVWLIESVASYIECIILIPSAASEIVHRVMLFFNLFNSKTCQLILGAGAMHCAGLKSITARHLALASQSIGAILAMIPSIEITLQSRLGIKNEGLLTDLERVQNDYSHHRDEIFDKIVSIMIDVINSSCTELVNQCVSRVSTAVAKNQSKKSFEENIPVLDAVHRLVKQTKQLYRVLSSVISPSQLDLIFGRVFLELNEAFASKFSTISHRVPPISSHDAQALEKTFISYQITHILNSVEDIHPIRASILAKLNNWVHRV